MSDGRDVGGSSGSHPAGLLLAQARCQVGELKALIGAADERALARPCRAKLGDGTVSACATHAARNYRRIAAYVMQDHERGGLDGRGAADHHGEEAAAASRDGLLVGLVQAERELGALGGLDEAALAFVPAEGGMRFADGRRSLQQVLEALLRHQAHQVAAVAAALA